MRPSPFRHSSPHRIVTLIGRERNQGVLRQMLEHMLAAHGSRVPVNQRNHAALAVAAIVRSHHVLHACGARREGSA